MKPWFLNNRKAWLLCIIGFVAAFVSFWFLPERIPFHFSGGGADGFAGKIWIFLFPAIEIFIALLGSADGFREWCMKQRPRSLEQFYIMIFLLVGVFLAVELVIIFVALKG